MEANQFKPASIQKFERLPHASDLAQIVYRLVVGLNGSDPYVVGTATALCGNLAITARHVIEDIARREIGVEMQYGEGPKELSIDCNFGALQSDSEDEYHLWDIHRIYICPHTDIAFIHFKSPPRSTREDFVPRWASPIVNPLPPVRRTRIAGFGYRKSRVTFELGEDGTRHYNLDDELTASTGSVVEVHHTQRDARLISWPCYQTSARFDSGMSGGPVFDEQGCLCGIICASYDLGRSEEEPISYVSTLWPMFEAAMQGAIAGKFSAEDVYFAIELVRQNCVRVVFPEGLYRILSVRRALAAGRSR